MRDSSTRAPASRFPFVPIWTETHTQAGILVRPVEDLPVHQLPAPAEPNAPCANTPKRKRDHAQLPSVEPARITLVLVTLNPLFLRVRLFPRVLRGVCSASVTAPTAPAACLRKSRRSSLSFTVIAVFLFSTDWLELYRSWANSEAWGQLASGMLCDSGTGKMIGLYGNQSSLDAMIQTSDG